MPASINPLGQDAQGIMEQLRNRIQGLDDTSASYLLRQMGLDPSMLHLLRMTRGEFEELAGTVQKYQLTEEQSKQIQALNVQLQMAQIQLKYLRDRAILAIMPAFTQFMKSIARVTEGIARFVNWCSKAINSMPRLAKGLLGVAAAIGAIRVALNLLNNHPIVRTISLILGALFLLIDDIMAYFHGGGSALGVVLQFFDELAEKINSIEAPAWLKDLLALITGNKSINLAAETIGNIEKVKTDKDFGAMFDIFKKAFIPAPMGFMMGASENMQRLFMAPQAERSINNNTTTNQADNRKISMTNNIYTSQAGQAVADELAYVQQYAYSFG